MKAINNVYVLVQEYEYEGWGVPDGVFTTLSRAKNALKKKKAGDWGIIRMKLDKPGYDT